MLKPCNASIAACISSGVIVSLHFVVILRLLAHQLCDERFKYIDTIDILISDI
ncbi:MAG: hypothetical protein ACI8PY_000800 [Oceanospirillaceae bacterium]